MDKGGELINRPSNKGKSWNGKFMRKPLLIVTVANPKWFTPKDKLVTYTGIFIELYNKRNSG